MENKTVAEMRCDLGETDRQTDRQGTLKQEEIKINS